MAVNDVDAGYGAVDDDDDAFVSNILRLFNIKYICKMIKINYILCVYFSL